ncbi:MAG: hemolysin family protein [Pirellulales bacterium]|jgi:CBS domain containing-hemolysin-like protein|nr:hemolysin family protein [Pirellulales bacterium]
MMTQNVSRESLFLIMSEAVLIWLAVAGLLTTGVAALGARSLVGFSRHELEEVCRRREAPQRLGDILHQYERVALAAETFQVLGMAVALAAAVYWATLRFHEGIVPSWQSALAEVGAFSLAMLVAAIWLPWTVARLYAEPFLFFTWPLWRAVGTAMAPLVLAARFFDTVLHRLADRQRETSDEESFEDEIRTIVTEGHREGLLEEDAREMIEGVIELSDVVVSEIMTPRTDMVSMPRSLTWQEALDFVVRVGHTRIPVHEKTRDDIIGILYAKDLLQELAKGPDQPRAPWTSLLREPHFVPETKPVDVLLQEFQRDRTHMVVVLDEYGGVSGLVTMEDVLEEIVGEIIDEYDKDLVDGIREIDGRTAEVLGRVHVDEINERLALELPEEEDYDTIGGFVFTELGHVPVNGEELLWKNLRITVVEATRRRIERVRIEVLDRSCQETA